jgi:ATP-dependent Clp protease ATP-binding subunit ClpA
MELWWPEKDVLSNRGFTDSCALVIQQIKRRAYERGLLVVADNMIPTLALWTLIRWERKVGLAALEAMGVDLTVLTDQLDRLLYEECRENPVAAKNGVLVYRESGEPVPKADWQILLEPLLGQAERESAEIGHSYVGTEHVLLAVIKIADAKLSSLLDQHLVRYENVKKMILEILST